MFLRARSFSSRKRRQMAERQLARRRNESLAMVERNIETMEEHRLDADKSRSTQDRIAEKLGITVCDNEELKGLEKVVKPKEVLDTLETKANGHDKSRSMPSAT